jgi:hypothetical protein
MIPSFGDTKAGVIYTQVSGLLEDRIIVNTTSVTLAMPRACGKAVD